MRRTTEVGRYQGVGAKDGFDPLLMVDPSRLVSSRIGAAFLVVQC